jgi:hypothetical protein
MKQLTGKKTTAALLLTAGFLLLLGLWSCSDGGTSYSGHSYSHGPSYYYRSAWDHDRYYRSRVDHYYDRTRERRTARREAIQQRRATTGRPARPARMRRR